MKNTLRILSLQNIFLHNNYGAFETKNKILLIYNNLHTRKLFSIFSVRLCVFNTSKDKYSIFDEEKKTQIDRQNLDYCEIVRGPKKRRKVN